MEKIKLEAKPREKKGGLASLRSQGWVPAILYGKKTKPQMLQVPQAVLTKVTATEAGLNAIFNITIGGQSGGLVRIREYQADPIKRSFTHVDFQTVDLKEKIEVEVPIQITGKAQGVKDGGVLEQQRRTLHLKCLVSNIPDHIEMDVSLLKIGDSIHADELKLPEGVEFPHETNFTVVACVPPTKEEEVKPVEAVAVEGEAAAATAEGEAKAETGKGAAPEKGKEPSKPDAPKKEEAKGEKK